jgi:FlaA1/EpsC-like NDP-sugar epimerase
VIQAGAMSKGGDVFVLDMGEPVRVYDLAKRMIELSGLKLKTETELDGDIEIEVIGLRPGEKLFEELLIGNDPLPTRHPKIFKANEDFLNHKELEMVLKNLKLAMDRQEIRSIQGILSGCVNGYLGQEIVDWIELAQNQFEHE